MAPKRNQAKPKRGSFLTRGREQLRQRQQTRQQASRQLPPQGGTNAGSVKARGQRLKTAVEQRARMDVIRTRALGQMLQRNADRNARADGIREESRMTSGKTRYVPPGGENAKGPGSLPPGQRGGDMRQKGGPLATRDKGGPMTQRGGGMTRTNNGGPVREVNVRDMGNNPQRQLPGQRGLPGGTGGADRVTASGARTGQPGPNRMALPPSLAQAAEKAAAKRPSMRRGMVEAVVGTLGQAAIAPAARALGKGLANAVRPIGRAIDDRLPGTNSKDEAQRSAKKQPLPRPTPDQTRTAVRLTPASPAEVTRSQTNTPAVPRVATTSRQQLGSQAQRASNKTRTMTGSTSSMASRVDAPAAPGERRVSAATANRESGNYGTSRSDNKLIDDYLRDKMLQREVAQQETNMTPDEKATLLKINKMKEEEKKKNKS